MKYTIITVNTEGYYSTQTITADTLKSDEFFLTFKQGKKILMLATDTVISINTEGFELQDKPQKLTNKKEHNARVIQLFRGRK